VRIKGAGERIVLEPELHRFLAYLERGGHLVVPDDSAVRETLVAAYLEQYRSEIKRKVDRYRRKVLKEEKQR